jgi:hypothetical protein
LEHIDIPRPPGYEIISISGNDLDTVGDLRRQMLSDDERPSSQETVRSEWLYSKNPAGPAEILGLRRSGCGWVGMIAIIPREVWVDCAIQSGAYLCDFYVNRQHRTLLPALSLQRFANERLKQTDRISYAVPNDRSLQLFRRIGAYKEQQRHRWVRPIRTRPYFIRHGHRALAMASPLIDASQFLFDLATSRLYPALRTERIDEIDARFDNLWSKLPRTGRNIGDRSSRYLRWRFQQDPVHRNQIIGLVDQRSGELAAYVVGTVVHDEFVIRDAISAAPQGVTAPMLAHFMLAIRRIGVAAAGFKILATDAQYRALRHAAFTPRDPEYVFTRKPPFLNDCAWSLTGADEDV